MPEAIQLGIDFGTTTTEIALRRGEGLPVTLPIGENRGKNYMPSVVLFTPGQDESGTGARVGEEAETIPKSSYFVHSIKRCLGCHGERCAANRENGCHWCQGDGRVHLPDGTALAPERIAFFILREALQRAKELAWSDYGIDLTTERLVLTPTLVGCGASFTLQQRTVILQAAHAVGFKKLTLEDIVEEPILAGYAFSHFASKPEGRVLIYDFGGGSFDVAILDVDSQKNVTVVATAGEAYLGGDDIDALILVDLIRQIAEQVNKSQDQVRELLTPTDYSMMRRTAKEAKESLSLNSAYDDSLFLDSFGAPPRVKLNRADLERLLNTPRADGKSLMQSSLDTTLRACKLAYAFDVAQKSDLLDYQKLQQHSLRDAREHITRVVLVGGVTEIPLVRMTLEDKFGADKIVEPQVIQPVEAVALGATYPRSSGHYSVAFPPYEFVLELQRASNSRPESLKVFDAYEYYRFHEAWLWNTIPAYRSRPIKLSPPCYSVRLGYRRAGHQDWNWVPVRLNGAGVYEFQVKLDGTVRLRDPQQRTHDLFAYPILHPLQRAITAAHAQRDREKREREIQDVLGRGNTTLTEN